jgi:predicted Zn-dependent protease
MNGGLPNAFALPGNMIIVTDELVRLPASDDELAAVLAHELAHLERRHGLQSLLRQSFAVLLAAGITGDASALTTFAAAIPLSLLTAGYSRDLEREADAYALELLRARGIPPRAFATVVVKLDAARESLQRNSTYTSTHPATDERTDRFGGLAPLERAAVLAEPAAARAAEAMRRSAPGDALPHLDKLVALHPVARSFTLRARCLYELHRLDPAESDLTRALELAPDDLDARLLRLELRVLGRPEADDLRPEARALLAQHPENASVLALLGHLEARHDDLTAAAARLDAALAAAPTGYLAWGLRGSLHVQRGDAAAARTDLDKAIDLEPGAQWLYALRGRVLLKLRKPVDALADFARVTTPALQTAAYFHDRGAAELARGNAARAIDDFGRGLALRPAGELLAQLHFTRGGAQLRLANFGSAENDFTAALAAGSTLWRVPLQRAIARRHLGRPREALPDFAAAATAAGTDTAALTQIRLEEVYVHFDLADYEAAIALCDAVLAAGPHAGAFQSRGALRFAQGEWSAAEADLNRALEISRRPTDEYHEFFRLLARRRLGADEKLKDFTVAVTAWRPGWGKTVGRYLAGQLTEDRLLAEADFSTGSPSQKERRCEAYFYIGYTHLLAGDTAKARSYFQRSVETGVINFYEYRFARAELARLRRAP